MRFSSTRRVLVLATIMIGLLVLGSGCSAKKASAPDAKRSASSTETVSTDATGGSTASNSTTGSGQSSATPSGSGSGTGSKSGSTTTKGTTGTRPTGKGAPRATLAVTFVNGTKAKPLSHVEIRSGSAVFRPGTRKRMDRGELTGLPASGSIEFAIYPDGADGKKIVVPMDIKADFAAGTQPKVDVAISDTNVQVLRYGAKSMGMATYERF